VHTKLRDRIPVQMAQEVLECGVIGIRKLVNTLMQSYMSQAVVFNFCRKVLAPERMPGKVTTNLTPR
jgi:hypothetical protein